MRDGSVVFWNGNCRSDVPPWPGVFDSADSAPKKLSTYGPSMPANVMPNVVWPTLRGAIVPVVSVM